MLAQTIGQRDRHDDAEEAGRPPHLGKRVVVAVGRGFDQQRRHRRATLPVSTGPSWSAVSDDWYAAMPAIAVR